MTSKESVAEDKTISPLTIEASLVGSVNWNDSTCLDILSNTSPPIIVYASRQSVYALSYSQNCGLIPLLYFAAHHERISGIAALPSVSSVSRVAGSDSTNPYAPQLVTCGQDGFVRVWSDVLSVSKRQCVHELNLTTFQTQQHSFSKPSCVATVWDTEGDLSGWRVAVGSENGGVVVWSSEPDGRRQDTAHRKTEKDSVTILVWHPNFDVSSSSRELAVGFKRGLVVIYVATFTRGKTTLNQVHRIKAHDSDICCLAWSPCSQLTLPGSPLIPEDSVAEGSPRHESGRLATSGKDRTVKLWSTQTNTVLKHLRLQGNNPFWISLCWVNDGRIIVSNNQGEIGIWNIADDSTNSKHLTIIPIGRQSRGHTRQIFCIRSFTTSAFTSPLLVTTSMDRSIAVWTTQDPAQSLTWTANIGGFVYCLSSSSVAGSTVAVGTGDNLIRLWRLNTTSAQPGQARAYDIITVWNGINGRVTAVAWHPTKEGLLAFGTDDGRVGVVNTLGERRQARVSNSHHKGTVFGVSWGPQLSFTLTTNGTEDPDAKEPWLSLYSIGKYRLFCHDPGHLNDTEAVDVGCLLPSMESENVSTNKGAKERAEVIFRARDYMAVGNADGSVEIFSLQPVVKLVCVITAHKKSINVLRWHPTHHWLAVATNNKFIGITDLESVIERFEKTKEDEWKPMNITESVVKLEGHANRVTGLDWSPHNPDRLVSVSFDGVALVWDVGLSDESSGRERSTENSKSQSRHLVCSFRGHEGRLFCCLWSPKDPDLVLTGGEDHNLFAWRPSLQSTTLPASVRKTRPPKSKIEENEEKPQSKEESNHKALSVQFSECSVDKDEMNQMMQLIADKKKELTAPPNSPSRSYLTNNTSSPPEIQVSSSPVTEQPTPPPSTLPPKSSSKRRRPGLFAHTLHSLDNSIEAQHRALLELASYTKGRLSTPLPPYLALYGTRRELMGHLKEEMKYQLGMQHLDNYFILLLWMGCMGQVVNEAWSLHYLPDWLLAMTCLAGTSGGLDKRLVDEKVRQTVEQTGDVILAATYHVACHQISEAIDLLVTKQSFKEALVLAVLRLSPRDPIRQEVLLQLAAKEARSGLYDQAARSYLAADCSSDAAQWLVRRQSLDSYWSAARMFAIVGEVGSCRSHLLQLVNQCLIQPADSTGAHLELAKKWKQLILDETDHSEYGLLFDLYEMLAVESSECSLTRLYEMVKEANSHFGQRLSNLEDDLLTAAISRQRTIVWNQVFVYFVHDLFLALYQSSEELEMAPSRLSDSLLSCASIDRCASLTLAKRLLVDASSDTSSIQYLVKVTQDIADSLTKKLAKDLKPAGEGSVVNGDAICVADVVSGQHMNGNERVDPL